MGLASAADRERGVNAVAFQRDARAVVVLVVA